MGASGSTRAPPPTCRARRRALWESAASAAPTASDTGGATGPNSDEVRSNRAAIAIPIHVPMMNRSPGRRWSAPKSASTRHPAPYPTTTRSVQAATSNAMSIQGIRSARLDGPFEWGPNPDDANLAPGSTDRSQRVESRLPGPEDARALLPGGADCSVRSHSGRPCRRVAARVPTSATMLRAPPRSLLPSPR